MGLKLSLPKGKVVWALAHPVSRNYIHEVRGVGYQECQLIVTEKDQPVEVNLDDYPTWAQSMIITSLGRGDLVNTGDPVTKPKSIDKIEAKNDVTAKVEEPKKATKKKAKKKVTKSSSNKDE